MQKLSVQQQKCVVGGAAKATAKRGLGLTTFFVMMLPSLIATVIEGGLAINNAINNKGENATSTASRTGFSAPRAFVRLSPVPSRSTVSYGLPGYIA